MTNGDDDKFEGHEEDPGREPNGRREDPFEGRTYLYIRDHPFDDGSEPLNAALSWWLSPDITVVKPDGTSGGEAVAGELNAVQVTVTNAGGIDAVDAFVDVFISNPTTSFTPSGADPVGGGFVTIPGYGSASISLPWTPTAAQAGHRCLAARVSLLLPPDTYANGLVFAVPADRHVAQRNISVVSMTAMKTMSFQFVIANPGEEAGVFIVRAQEIRMDDEQVVVARAALRCGAAQFADTPLAGIGLNERRIQKFEEPDADDERDYLPAPQELFGVLPEPVRRPGEEQMRVELEPSGTRHAAVTVVRGDDARPGDLNVLEVTQRDENETVVGGFWLVVSN